MVLTLFGAKVWANGLPGKREARACRLKSTEGVYRNVETPLLGHWQGLVLVKKALVTALQLCRSDKITFKSDMGEARDCSTNIVVIK